MSKNSATIRPRPDDARNLPVEIQAELARRGLIPGVLLPSAPTPPDPE